MIAILVASVNENMKLAVKLQEELKQLNHESTIVNLVDMNLPLYNTIYEEKEGLPHAIQPLVETMQNAQGFICVAPEYNGSTPPVLSNAISWLSRTSKDFRQLFDSKIVLLATHSGSLAPGLMQTMRTQFVKLGSMVLSREIILTYEKKFNPEIAQTILKQLIKFLQY